MADYEKHLWKAKTYESREEICDFVNAMGICKKQVKDISIIGFAKNMSKSKLAFTARRSLAEVGVPYDEIEEGKYPHWLRRLFHARLSFANPSLSLSPMAPRLNISQLMVRRWK